uniref:Uncharacterized protein n=1 Tax=Octopus bimaculoides TaxID=37653 RepID=A0A0L8FJ87_OCTBM
MTNWFCERVWGGCGQVMIILFLYLLDIFFPFMEYVCTPNYYIHSESKGEATM